MKKPVGIETIKRINKEYEEAEHIKDVLKELLDYARRHDFLLDVDEYTKAKRMTLDYISHLREYKKELVKGIYQEL